MNSSKPSQQLEMTEHIEDTDLPKNESVPVFDEVEIDPIEERKVVQKLDRVVLPLLAIIYFMQCIITYLRTLLQVTPADINHLTDLDKGSIGYAAIFGLRDDLRVSGSEYSWAVSLFYFGQLCSEYPVAFVLGRFRLIPFVGTTIIIWGGVEMALGATQNFRGLAATRFFLGFSEASVSPAFIIITSNWYKRSEHPLRVATWVSMNGISQIIGALIMYAVGGAKKQIESWRVIFLIFGGLTCACGVAFLVLMPRDTTTAWFLNERECLVATQRLAHDRATRDRAEFNKSQLFEALSSPFTWLFFVMALCITLTTPILKFSSIMIEGAGFSNHQSMLVGLPSGAVNFATVWVSALVPRLFPGRRIYTAIGIALVPFVGSIILLVLPIQGGGWGVVSATWLAGCSSANVSSTASLIASNVKGNTKKSVISATFFIAYCVGCIIGPQLWTEDDYPRYKKGCILSIASWASLIVVYVVYMVLVQKENKRRDVKASQGLMEYMTEEQNPASQATPADSDLTDVEDKGFRYST